MPRPPTATLLATLILAACGGRDDAAENAPPATIEQAMEQATEAIRERGGAVEPIDAEKLQARLPRDVDGLERVDVKREETGAMGMKISATTARYEGDEGRVVTIAISDIGGLGGMGAMGAAAWSMSEFDRTTTSGYERTTRLEGFKAMESLSRQGGRLSTELNILVGERFIVQLKGQNVEIDVLKDATRALDLRDLARER